MSQRTIKSVEAGKAPSASTWRRLRAALPFLPLVRPGAERSERRPERPPIDLRVWVTDSGAVWARVRGAAQVQRKVAPLLHLCAKAGGKLLHTVGERAISMVQKVQRRGK